MAKLDGVRRAPVMQVCPETFSAIIGFPSALTELVRATGRWNR